MSCSVYTGIHYDALVENDTSDPTRDRTLFPSHDDLIRTRADITIKQLQKDKQFTNGKHHLHMSQHVMSCEGGVEIELHQVQQR